MAIVDSQWHTFNLIVSTPLSEYHFVQWLLALVNLVLYLFVSSSCMF